MLVLTRRTADKILLPTLGVEIVVLRVEGQRVRLGISAPADVRVHRQEIAQRIEKEHNRERPIGH